jgi:iron complex outermembrane receptor protein
MKQQLRKKRLVIACAHAMALMFAQQAISAEQPIINKLTVSTEGNAEQIAKKQQSIKDSDNLEVIQVTGYQSSIEKALSRKRNANGVVDGIIAEDIGKMADSNVAEAMQRISGISINREGGEGTTVSIRGLGPEMNQVSINGQTITGGGDGGAVSFDVMSADMLSSIEVIKTPNASTTEGSLGGQINLKTVRPLERKSTVFTAQLKESYNELADQVDPTFQINYIDQFNDNTLGLAFNTVYERRRSRTDNVATLGWEGNNFSHDTNGLVYMESAEGVVYRLDKNTGNLFDNVGNAAQLFDSVGNAITGVDSTTLTEQSQLGYMPTFLLSEYIEQDRTRKGASLTFEYQPTEQFNSYLDFSHTQLSLANNKSMIRHSYKRGEKGLFADDSLAVYTGAEIDPFSETITRQTDMRGSRQLILQQNEQLTKTSVVNLGFDYELDVWNIAGRIGYSTTKQTLPSDDRLVFSSGEILHGYSLENNPQLPEYIWGDKYNTGKPIVQHPPTHTDSNIAYGDQLIDGTWYYSPTSKHNSLASVYHNDRDVDDNTLTGQLDVEYLLDSDNFRSIQFGGQYTKRETDRYSVANGLAFHQVLTLLRNQVFLDDGALAIDFPVDNFLDSVTQSGLPNQGVVTDWAFGDFNQINKTVLETYNKAYNKSLTNLDQLPWLADLRQSYLVEQEFIAVYAQVNVDTLDGRLVGDFGVRVVQTNNESSGYAGGQVLDTACVYNENNFDFAACEAKYNKVTNENDYTEVLPTANFRYAISENLLARVAVGKAMARPTMYQIAPYVTESVTENNPENAFRRSGNPELDPMTAWQYDISLEWYFNQGGILAAGLFYKDIDTFIYDRTDTVFEDMLDSDNTPYQGIYAVGEEPRNINPYKVTKPVNGEGASIVGLESSYSQSFTELPGELAGLGVALNYTYADSSATYIGSNHQGEEVAVETAFKGQSKHTYNASVYWEKYSHSLRLSYNYRTDSLYAPITATKDMIWSDAYGQLDFSARFAINTDLSLGLQAINLTNEIPYRYHTNAWDGNPVDSDVYENRLSSYSVNGRTYRLTINATF